MSIVKLGIVGIGNMGSAHTKFVYELPEVCQLTAVCDINPAAFERVTPELKETVPRYPNVETMLREADVDAVIVSVPHYDHPSVAIAAMRAGKHVLVEKPIAVHKQAAEELLAEGAKHPELVQALMFNQRRRPAHIKLKEMITGGELGRLMRINWIITDWFRSQAYYDSGDWRASWRGEGGGVLTNQCPHQLDLLQWLFGMPVKVRAWATLGKYHDIEVEDYVNAYMEYPDGMTGNFIASTGEMPGTNRLEIMAERGRVVLENGKLTFIRNEVETTVFTKTTDKIFGIAPHETIDIPLEDENSHQHRDVIEAFCKKILGQGELVAPMSEGIKGLELGNAMLLSGLKNKEVSLPIDAAEYAEMLSGLVAKSRYVKKTIDKAADATDFSKSY